MFWIFQNFILISKNFKNKEITIFVHKKNEHNKHLIKMLYEKSNPMMGWLVGWLDLYGISTFVGHLMPNPFYTNNQFYFRQFSLARVHSLIIKNISISSNLV